MKRLKTYLARSAFDAYTGRDSEPKVMMLPDDRGEYVEYADALAAMRLRLGRGRTAALALRRKRKRMAQAHREQAYRHFKKSFPGLPFDPLFEPVFPRFLRKER